MSYDTTVLAASNLLAYWKFNETSGTTINDSVGTADLTLVGGVTLNQPSLNADTTKSALFDGTGCAYANGPDYQPLSESQFMFWFKANDLTTQRQCFFYVNSGPGSEGWGFILNGNGRSDGSLWVLRQGVSWKDLGIALSDTNPHHMSFNFFDQGGLKLARIVLDGVQIYESYTDTQAGPATFVIGAENVSGGNGFKGRIQQFSVINRNVPQAEVGTYYNAPSASGDDEARMNVFKTTIYDRYRTGSNPYVIRYKEDGITLDSAPNGAEHYDPACCFFNAEAFCKYMSMTPNEWDTEQQNGIVMWRDGWVRALRAQGYTTVAGYNHHTHGLALDYVINGSTLSRETLRGMIPEEWGHASTPELYKQNYGWNYWGREQAFRLMGSLDLKLAGYGEHAMLHTEAEICLWHNEGFLNPTERYGRYVRPWMQGLAFRSLIYYWFTYRDSTDPAVIAIRDQIPPLCEAFVTWCMGNAWYPPGSNVPIAFEGAYWDHGAFAYQTPAGQSPGFTHITGLTIQSVQEPNRLFTGPSSLSTVDNYYRHLLVETYNGTRWIKNYIGATRQFEVYWDAINAAGTFDTVGQVFNIHTLGDDGAGGNAPDGAMPVGNTIVSPIASFCYWHRKFILGDAAGAAIFRTYHQQIWDGQKMAWGNAYSQKEYNEGMLWGTLGIGYRDAGDANQNTQYESLGITYADPGAPVETYTLSIDGATGYTGQESGGITVSLDIGTVASPITFTIGFTGVTGALSATTIILDETTRSGSVTLTPTSVGTAVISVTNDGGLPNPASVSYMVTNAPSGDVTSYTMTLQGPHSGNINVPSGTIRIELGEGNLAWTLFTFSVTGVIGTFSNTTRNLNSTFRWGETVFIPTSAGIATISVTNNGGLPNPSPIIYEVAADLEPEPITPAEQPDVVIIPSAGGRGLTFYFPSP